MINTACERLKYVDLPRIRRMVDEGPFDAIVALSPDNVPYFSGFYNMDLRLLPERLHIAVWPRNAEPAFVVMERRARLMQASQTYIEDLRGYQGEGLDSMRALAAVLRDRGVHEGLIGFEGRTFPGGHLLELQRLLPKLRFRDAVSYLDRIRAIKTPAELEVQTRINRLTTDSIDTAFRAARPGMTEIEIAARMEFEFVSGGAEQITAPLLAAGPRTGLWHGMPSSQRVENGMVLITDFGGQLEGYYSDIARTAVMGKATDHQKDIHAKITGIKHRIVGYMKPGMTAGEVARFGRKCYDDVKLEFKWFILGHGIGLGLHEEPQLYPDSEELIEEGMVMMVEVGYSDFPNESFHVEDLVHLKAGGAEYVTDATKHEKLWELGLD
ncbi:MAG: Xaa-Pro peptidase family protein [Chloroflexota bacterium]